MFNCSTYHNNKTRNLKTDTVKINTILTLKSAKYRKIFSPGHHIVPNILSQFVPMLFIK